MTLRNRRPFTSSWLSLLLLGSAYACGSSQSGDLNGAPGASCSKDAQCASGACVSGKCADKDGNAGEGSGGTSSSSGGSTSASGGKSGSSGGTTGSSTGGTSRGGTSSTSGAAGAGEPTGTGNPGSGTSGPHFDGSGSGFRPLTPGCGPDTAGECTGSCEQRGGDPVTIIRPPATLCFAGEGDATPDDPSAVIEQVIERLNGVAYVHIRVTFDPSFTDNTFGEGACCGWPERRGHHFSDLEKSDHTELLLTNGEGETVMNFKIDLISADATADCGYGTLGVRGGDGSVIVGNPDDVLAVSTSLDRNLNGCGYCKNDACASSGDCTVDSPPTDENFTPNPGTPNWDYRQVYEVWIALDAFGDPGFGQAYITYTHSSPAKSTDTLTVEPEPCPPDWDRPYCPPSVIQEGGNCFGSGGSGGMGGSGGTGGSEAGAPSSGGTSNGGTGGTGGSPCPPNYQTYITTEGASICTPIPYANYDDMKPCPAGYVLDIASEGQFCIPTT